MAASRILMISSILVTIHSQSCDSNPCQNDGMCLSLSICPDVYECDCPDGWIGQNCETPDDPCGGPCLNGGTCNTLNGGTCACGGGYTGDNCEESHWVCDPGTCDDVCIVCSNDAPCSDGLCDCSGLCFTGRLCADVVDCCTIGTTDCFEGCINGKCETGVCVCDAGFTGTCCDIDAPIDPIDPCEPDPCSNGETCFECPDSTSVCLSTQS
eukprot:135031_1